MASRCPRYFSRLGVFFFLLTYSLVGYSQKERNRFAVPPGFYAQPEKKNTIRTFLSKFSLLVSTGYNHTFYSHQLDGFGVLQRENGDIHIFSSDANTGGSIFTSYTNWFNDTLRVNNVPVTGQDFLANSDTTDLGFKTSGYGIPLNLGLTYRFDRYRVGLGFSLEKHKVRPFKATNFGDQIGEFTPGETSFTFTKFYAILGADILRYNDYLFGADVQVGTFNLGGKFNQGIIEKRAYLNLGVFAEREFSEYFRAFARFSYDFKGYDLAFPETSLSVNHRMPALNINFGISISLPELPRCPIKDCKTQINHLHVYKKRGAVEFRSREHPIYKWQNPHHGQNYPKLIKYKKKNKKKLNPY